jgi:hypothetical protein
LVERPMGIGCCTMKSVFAVLLGAAVWWFGASAATADTLEELLQSCEAVISTAGQAKGDTVDIPAAGLSCWYYVSAIQDMSVLADERGKRLLGICPPRDSTIMDFVRIFVQYAHRNQEEVYGNAAAVAVLGLSRAFPCRGSRGH